MINLANEYTENLEINGTGNGEITDKPWNGAKSRFTIAQLLASVPPTIARAVRARARKEGKEIEDIPKDWIKLPHHEPDGTLNANGVRAAKGKLNRTDLPEGVTEAMCLNHLDMHSGQIERWREGKGFYPCNVTTVTTGDSNSEENEVSYKYLWNNSNIKETHSSQCDIVSFPTFEAGIKAIKADVDLALSKKDLTNSDKAKIREMAYFLKKTSNELVLKVDKERLEATKKEAETLLSSL